MRQGVLYRRQVGITLLQQSHQRGGYHPRNQGERKKIDQLNNIEKAYKCVKNELIAPDFLAHYNPKEQIILACDASDYGLSAILSHRYSDGTEQPIAYASKKIPTTEIKRAIIDKEAMAIIFGFNRFYEFVFGKEIILRTDNKTFRINFGPEERLTTDRR